MTALRLSPVAHLLFRKRDDDRAIRTVLAITLRLENIDVDLAASGEQAVEMLADSRPDIVVLDLNMPGIDGRETHRLLGIGGFSGPVVICSAYDARGAHIELGTAASLTKPFDPNELVKLVNRLLPA